MRDFGKITDIIVDDTSTWENRCFLTIDIDWCHDQVLDDCINLVEMAGISATWFVTHKTLLIDRLKNNPKFELAIHPNFNFLLSGNTKNGRNADEVIDRLLEIVPESKSVRSHSMTQNTNLLNIFIDKGLTHDCNHFIPEQTNIELKPWKLWNGLTKVPYFWEDDVASQYIENTPLDKLVKRGGVKVFDFHPIHIFLNTENIQRYETTRHLHQNPKKLIEHRCKDIGTRNYFKDLIALSTHE